MSFLLNLSAAAAVLLVTFATAGPVPYTFHNTTTTPTFSLDFWSGIACTGAHVGNFTGPPKNYTHPIDQYIACEPIPYPGVTGAVTFRGDHGYYFGLHHDAKCFDYEGGAGGIPNANDTNVCLKTNGAVAWSVAMVTPGT